MITLYGVSAPLGSGKTTAAIEHAGSLAQRGEKFVIAQPSIRLINQSIAQARKRWPNVAVHAIHSTLSPNVARAIADYTQAAPGGQILFVTHAALLQDIYWHRSDRWNLIIDEAPQLFWMKDIILPVNRHVLVPALEAEPYNVRYARLVPHDVPTLERMAQNRGGDDVDQVFQDLAAKIISPKWDVFVLAEQLERLKVEQVGDGKMSVFGLLDPLALSGFASTTLMSANLESTIAYRHLVERGCRFKTHKTIIRGLQFTTHDNGGLLTVHYAMPGQWSKRRRDKAINAGGVDTTIGDLLVAGALELFGAEAFVWQTNKDLEACDPFAGHGIPLPHLAHGLNEYQHIHNAVVIPALNPSPALYNFLDEVAHIDPDEVRHAVYHESVYQATGRISTRKLADQTQKHVVVADQHAAERLAALYPGAQVVPLPCASLIPHNQKPGPKRKHVTDAARKAAFRANRKADLIDQLDLLNRSGETNFPIGLYKDSSRQIEPAFGGSAFLDVRCRQPLEQFDGNLAGVDFITFLREMHARKVAKKDAGLWCVATYQGGRSLDNITAIHGVFMDNDGGDLGIDEFVAMFPHLQLMICNSASSTRDRPKWRVIIPTTCAMSLDVHAEIVGQIRKSLAARGYYDKHQLEKRAQKRLGGLDHGFDPSKFNAAALFYLPAQATAGPEHSFFLEFTDGKRLPINPYQWVDHTILRHQPSPEPVAIPQAEPAEDEQPRSSKQERIAAAITQWRSTTQGQGNHAFNRLAWRLSAAGMAPTEVEQTLYEEASYARSAGDRQRQVRHVVNGLRRRGKGRVK